MANLFLEDVFFFFSSYWIGLNKVKIPDLSGAVWMPDYIFYSWEDIPKCWPGMQARVPFEITDLWSKLKSTLG